MPRRQIDSDELAVLRHRLDGWRRLHGGRGRRIPDELWLEAAELARREGVGLVARELRLGQERLERLAVEQKGDLHGDLIPDFVQVQLPTVAQSVGSIFVRFEAPDGRRLQLEFPSTTTCDVGAIFAAFAGQPR